MNQLIIHVRYARLHELPLYYCWATNSYFATMIKCRKCELIKDFSHESKI
jgi:hypothetical protein